MQVRWTLNRQERARRTERRREAYVTLSNAVEAVSSAAATISTIPAVLSSGSSVTVSTLLQQGVLRYFGGTEEGLRALAALELLAEPQVEKLRALYVAYSMRAIAHVAVLDPKANAASWQDVLKHKGEINSIIGKAVAALDDERQQPLRHWWRFWAR